ncbi:MAG: helix-turn-helix domain-containing protein [Planctomycetaceae bacterium]
MTAGPPRTLGVAVFVHALSLQSVAGLTSCFRRFAFTSDHGFLPPEELAEALKAENAADLIIGGSVDLCSETITLWRGSLTPLTVPFSAFEKSGDGIEPDFGQFAVTDFGQTVQLGHYEASADAILYEFDPQYRRRISRMRQQSERSFGASLRRLRKQRGLRREDFEPEVTGKTIARIEQGVVRQVHKKTLDVIAKRLRVTPAEIESF